jgi:hypothetical protein
MALRELLAQFDVKIPIAQIKAGGAAVDKLGDQLKGYAQFYSSAEIVQGIRGFVEGLTQQATTLQDLSDQLSVGTQDLQRWGLAAELSGANQDTLARGLLILQKNAEGNEKAFRSLGVDVRDAGGNAKETTALFREVGLAIGSLEDPSARTKAALEILGKPGAKLAPMFANGAEGLDQLLGELDRLGGGLSEDALRDINDFDDAMVRWEMRTRAVKASIAKELFPALETVMTKIGETVSAFTRGERGAQRLESALVVLGTAGAVAGLQMLAPWLPLILLIGAAYLIVDDLRVGLEGGESATGRLLDQIFGEGAGDSVFKRAREDLDGLRERLRDKSPFEAVEETLSSVGASIVRLFAEEIPQGVQDAFDAVGNGVATEGQKMVVDFVEFVKIMVLGFPTHFGLAAAKAAQTLITKFKESANIVELAGDLAGQFSAAFSEALKLPTLDFGGSRGDVTVGTSDLGNSDGSSGSPGFFGVLGRSALLGPASALFSSTGRAAPTINQTINQTITTQGPFARGDIRAGIDDANEGALGYLETTA